MADIRDVATRIITHLTLDEKPKSLTGEEPIILVAPEILPSQALVMTRSDPAMAMTSSTVAMVTTPSLGAGAMTPSTAARVTTILRATSPGLI